MQYLYIIFGVIIGLFIFFIYYRNRLRELKDLRYHYLLSQEEQTKFVKDKVLSVELDFYNFKEYVLSQINSKDTSSTQ